MTLVHEASRLGEVSEQLDAALRGLRTIADPHLPVRDAEAAIASALRGVYRAMGSGGDYAALRDHTGEVVEHVRVALTLLQASDTEDAGAISQLQRVATALQLIRSVSYHPDDALVRLPSVTSGPVRASLDEPQLLDPPREVHRPRVLLSPLPEPVEEPSPVVLPAPPKSLEEVRAMMAATQAALVEFESESPPTEPRSPEPTPLPPLESAASTHFGRATTEEEQLREQARDCLEDLAMLGLMRRHRGGPGQTWLGRERAEQRLLTRVDALVACGVEVLPDLLVMLEERPLPDPELTWATLFMYGSLAGDDSIDQARRIAECCDLSEPTMRDSVADAFSWAPHPRIDSLMRRWIDDPDRDRRVVAVRALARRRRITVELALRACVDPDVDVVHEGATALGVAEGTLPVSAFHPLLDHPHEPVVVAAIESAFLRGVAEGYRRAAQLTAHGSADFACAAEYVAIGAPREEGLQLLMEAAGYSGSALVLGALGTFGHVEPVPYLLQRLENGDAEVATAALSALERISGAGLTADSVSPTYENERLPFVRGFDDREALILEPDVDAWREWWRAHGARADRASRYRRGHGWTPLDALHEYADPLGSPRERRLCHLEMIARTGLTLPLEQEHFVSRQRTQIHAYWQSLNRPAQPGLWSVRWRS